MADLPVPLVPDTQQLVQQAGGQAAPEVSSEAVQQPEPQQVQTPPAPKMNAEDAASPRLYSYKTKEWVDVPAHQVNDAILSGQYVFQSGIQVPVVDANGQLGSIPSDRAYQEFANHGVSWATPQKLEAYEKSQNKQILQDNFGDQPLTAAAAGAARMATFGGSDVLANILGLSDTANEIRNRNPTANVIGEFGGMLLPGGLTGALAKGVGEGAGAVVASQLAMEGAAAGTIKAATTVAKLSAEGAVFGTSSGITEQALGHPEDVVNNYVSHIGLGALMGAGAGTLFGTVRATRPYVDSLIDSATGKVKDIASSVVNKVSTRGVVASLNKAGQEDLAKQVGPDLVNDLSQVYQEHGSKGVEKVVSQAKEHLAEAESLQGAMRTDLYNELKTAAEPIRQAAATAVERASGNIIDATDMAYEHSKQVQDNFRGLISSITTPVEEDGFRAVDAFTSLPERLAKTSPEGENLGRKIAAQLSIPSQTMGDEAATLFDLRSTLKNSVLGGQGNRVVKEALESVDSKLAEFPNAIVSKTFNSVKAAEASYDSLSAVARKTVMRTAEGASGHNIDLEKLAATMADPRQREVVNTVLDNVGQFLPEVQKMAAGFKDAAAQVALHDDLALKMSRLMPNGHVDGAEVGGILDMLGKPKNLAEKLQQITENQGALAQGTAWQKVLAFKQAMGENISADMSRAARVEQKLDLLNKIKDVQTTGLNKLRAFLAVKDLSHGSVLGAARNTILGMRSSTIGAQLDVLAKLQRASQVGATTVQNAVKNTAAALTGAKAEKVVRAAVGAATEQIPIKQQRKTFDSTKRTLQNYQPQANSPLADYAPQLAKQLQDHQTQTMQFLASKLPHDPLAENSLQFDKTGYLPSDHELSVFNRYVQAADKPLQVLENMKQNKVSPEEVETLKTLYPGIYDKLQTSVLNGIVKNGSDLGYQQKIQLSQLFNIPTDYTLKPDFVARMQQQLNTDQGGRPEGKSSTRKIQIDLKPEETMATSSQQTTYGLNRA